MTKNDATGWKAMSNSDRAAAVLAVLACIAAAGMLITGYSVFSTITVFLLLLTIAAWLYGIEFGRASKELIAAGGALLAFIAFLFAQNTAMERFKIAADTFDTVNSQRVREDISRTSHAAKNVAELAALRHCATFQSDLNNDSARAAIEARAPVPWSSVLALMARPGKDDLCLEARRTLREIDPRYPFSRKE